jgi:DNA helicase-2/ATP-dependent DNA helicase PcrA
MRLSYNKLKTFGECALKYRLAYVERLPQPPVRGLDFQRRLHQALALYHHFAKRDATVREEDLLAEYARLCEVERHPEVRESTSFQEGEEILRRYCETENQKGRVPAYLEHTLQFPFGPYTLTGKIDRLDFTEGKSYSIVDYKLDRKLPKENAAETSLQLSFYHLLVWEGLGVESEDVRLYYLRHGIEQVSHRSRAQLRETVEWIDETAASIHAERAWAPQEGAGCRTCAFQEVCPSKTGQERAPARIWQQGDLLWEMQQKPAEATSSAALASAPAASGGPGGALRQMTIDDYL